MTIHHGVIYGAVGPPFWDDRPLAIVGAGPSLAGFDFNVLNNRRWRVLAVKEPLFQMPWADAGFGLDMVWMRRRRSLLRECVCPLVLAVPRALEMGRSFTPPRDDALYLDRQTLDCFSDDPAVVAGGCTSGFGALNFAYLKRAKRIVIFGYDYGVKGGLHHYENGRYYAHNPGHWEAWAKRYRLAIPQIERAGMRIVNACADSRLDMFERVSVDGGLKILRGFAA